MHCTTAICLRLANLLFILFLVGTVSHAQAPTGGIAGNATDASGAVVAGVEVILRNVQTGESQTSRTNPDGYYEFLLLRPATYEITAHAKGFSSIHHGDIAVNVGSVVHLDLHLAIGEVSQTVEVTALVPLIEPERASISRTVDLKAISSLPMFGRQILNLALTVPGTIPSAPGTQVNSFSVAGMRSQSNNYTLDGISNNDPQVNGPLNGFRLADAIQEFNVQTSIASPEAGRNSGAQVNIITKSGTNDLHGSLFYTGRNDALDANDFFLNKAGKPKNALRRHQFGGTAGGRIIRDKTFWFFSYEGFRETFQQPVTARVPTVLERGSVSDPVSLKVLQFYPLPNATGTANWTGTVARISNDDTYFWRLDHNINSNHRMLVRHAWFHGSTDSLQSTDRPFHGNITNLPVQHSALIQENWTSAKLVNAVQLGYSRNRTFFQPTDVSLNPASLFTDAGGGPLPGYVDTSVDPLDGGLPNITIAGFAGFGAGTNMPQGRATNTYEAIDNISLLNPFGWSRHTFRFGGSLRHEITNRFLNGNYRGQISFSCFVPTRTCSNSFSDGHPVRGSLRTGAGGTFRTWSRNVWSWYAQDIYKPRTNWTVHYGLRWEYFGQSVEKLNRGSNFVPGIGMMVLGSNLLIDIDRTQLGRNAIILTPTNFQLPRSGQTSADYNNFAPFLGISWQPKILKSFFGEGKTVIRTGFRVSYDDIFANIPVNMGLNLPNVLSTTLPDATRANPYNWGTVLNQNRSLWAPNNVPGGRQGIVTFNAWDTNARTAYAMNYALEIEHQFGEDYSAGLSYVGSQGRKLGVFTDPNQPSVTVVNPVARGNQSPNLRSFPFQQYGGVFLGTFGSNSNYSGMVATLRRRANRGFSYSTSYTFGKSLDDNSSFFGSDRDNGSYADTRNRAAERARSDFDARHRVVGTMIYELPFGPGRRWLASLHGPLGHVVGGWDFSGIFQYRSGFPFTVFAGSSFDYSGFNQRADRPNFAPGTTNVLINYDDPDNVFACHNATGGGCSIFSQPLAGTIGNVGRNRFEGPTYTNLDFGASKNFPFGEGRRFQFRADLFNAFNKTNFGLPVSNAQFSGGVPTSSTIGTVQSTVANSQRIIQLTLRIDF